VARHNEELQAGHTRQIKPPLIDADQPVFKTLKVKISLLEKAGDHQARADVPPLKELRSDVHGRL